MTTGLDTFNDPASLGALYPFAGLEWLFVVLGVAFWIGWLVKQSRAETREYEEAKARFRELGLERVMSRGGSADIATEEEFVNNTHLAAERTRTDTIA